MSLSYPKLGSGSQKGQYLTFDFNTESAFDGPGLSPSRSRLRQRLTPAPAPIFNRSLIHVILQPNSRLIKALTATFHESDLASNSASSKLFSNAFRQVESHEAQTISFVSAQPARPVKAEADPDNQTSRRFIKRLGSLTWKTWHSISLVPRDLEKSKLRLTLDDKLP